MRILSGALIVAVIAICSFGGGATAANMGPKEYWQKGSEFAGNKLYIDAVEYYTRAIRANKGEIAITDVARIFNSRGLAYEGLNDRDKAIEDFSNAIELDDRNPEFYLNRAAAFQAMRKYEQARNDFSSAIKLDPRNTSAYAGRAKANQETGSPDLAIADYRKLLEFAPRNISALYGIGLAYKSKREDAKAIEAFNELLKIDPRYAAASYQNAALFSRAGKIDSACVWLEEAVANGYRDQDALKNDPDLDALRKTDCYRQALTGRR
jgi:tetratricopeptide (TPR) repeat protein